jgi:succinate dehydrogenase/fumarate reductase flavoprotein subunit
MASEIQTDVLVVGGGASGARAALEAHRSGAKVTLAVKGELGVMGVRGAGATGSGAPRYLHLFNSMVKHSSITEEAESYYQRAIRAGLGIANRGLTRILVEGAREAKRALDQWGLVLGSDNPDNPHGIESIITPMPGLANVIRMNKEIDVLQHMMVMDVLIEDNICRGAMAVHEETGEVFVLKAGAIVIATGGCAQLFRLSFHPTCITGDGYAMGYEAGAELMNMEFEQMFIATAYPAVTMAPYPIWGLHPRVLNAKRQEFIQNYLPQGVKIDECMDRKMTHGPFSTRDASKYIDIAMVKETKAGRANEHHAFYLEVPAKVRTNPGMLFPEFEDWYAYRGVDFSKDYVEINVAHQCSNGGFKIDENGQTTIPGLYAVGESATGAYGADRLGGAMMTSCQVFGARAGRHAASTAKTRGAPGIDKDLLQSKLEGIRSLKGGGGGQKPGEVKKVLQKKAWEDLLVVRSEESLNQILQEIERIRGEVWPHLSIENGRDLVTALELKNLMLIGEIVARAALKRTESRGSHYREDFPERNDSDWTQAITIKKVDGKIRLDTLKVDERWKADEAELGWWG